MQAHIYSSSYYWGIECLVETWRTLAGIISPSVFLPFLLCHRKFLYISRLCVYFEVVLSAVLAILQLDEKRNNSVLPFEGAVLACRVCVR